MDYQHLSSASSLIQLLDLECMKRSNRTMDPNLHFINHCLPHVWVDSSLEWSDRPLILSTFGCRLMESCLWISDGIIDMPWMVWCRSLGGKVWWHCGKASGLIRSVPLQWLHHNSPLMTLLNRFLSDLDLILMIHGHILVLVLWLVLWLLQCPHRWTWSRLV